MAFFRSVMKLSGGACLLFLSMMILSGWALSGVYIPSDAEAFSSILYLRKTGGIGQIIRSLHFLLSSLLTIFGFIFLISFYILGYVKSLKKEWIFSVILFLLIIGSSFTGYLLPMDQNAFWGTKVRLEIVESIPIAGSTIANLLRGGANFGSETLSRFFTLHGSFIPILIVIFTLILIQAHSNIIIKYLQKPLSIFIIIGGILTLYLITFMYPAPLELPANPIDVEYIPRPEWYFLWLFEFGKYVEWAPWIRSAVLPTLGVGFLLFLPIMKPQSNQIRYFIAGSWCSVWVLFTSLTLYADRNIPEKLHYEKAMIVQAEKNYESLCIDCHGKTGTGDGSQTKAFDLKTPDFTSLNYQNETDDSEMKKAIRDGKGKDMPAYKKKMNSYQIDSMVEFLKNTYFK